MLTQHESTHYILQDYLSSLDESPNWIMSWNESERREADCSCRNQSRYVPSQWETSLQCNDVSHWLGAYLNRSLHMHQSYRLNLIMKMNSLERFLCIAGPLRGAAVGQVPTGLQQRDCSPQRRMSVLQNDLTNTGLETIFAIRNHCENDWHNHMTYHDTSSAYG